MRRPSEARCGGAERGGERARDVVGVAYYNRSRAWIRDVYLVRVGAKKRHDAEKESFCSVVQPLV